MSYRKKLRLYLKSIRSRIIANRQFGSSTQRRKTVANVKPKADGTRLPACFALLITAFVPGVILAAEGELTLKVVDESTGEPIVARVELTRPQLVLPGSAKRRRVSRRSNLRVIRPLAARGTIETSFGFVLDGEVRLNLAEGPYEFRVTHGPEFRVVRGNFAIEKTSEDEHTVELPRILNMRSLGWTSGDALVPPSKGDLAERMRSEVLDVAVGPGTVEVRAGLAFYQSTEQTREGDDTLAALHRLAKLTDQDSTKVAIEDPFTWPLPVYLASQRIDGFFVLGDWLRLDKTIMQTKTGRPFPTKLERDAISLGREVEQIYWELLNAGFRLAPLAGTGDEAKDHPVGYNRLYVYNNYVDDSESLQPPNETDWWNGVWEGRSVATNGPLLQPRLDGKPPGYVFEIGQGESLSLLPEVTLTVRDPVEYLEVIQNGIVHYTARLDEFAKAGGRIKPMMVDQSGWAIIRVVTLHEGHFRAAMSAPWYFEVGGERRISKRSAKFFRDWLSDYETKLKSDRTLGLSLYAPFIRSARQFWDSRVEQANAR